MAENQHSLDVEKRLTYVFLDYAPLPNAKMNLGDGFFLAGLPPFLLQEDESYCVQLVRPQFSQFFEDHLHKTTLNIVYRGRSDLSEEGVNSEEEESYRKANQYLLAAVLHAPYFVHPYACFITIPSIGKVCHSKRMRDFGAIDQGLIVALGEADFTKIDTIYDAVKPLLPPNATGRLPTALDYYHQAFRCDISWPIRFLSMMMGIEALFSHGASEISHQVSERVAFFLCQEPDRREKLYQQLRDFYRLRSTIAHGGTVTDKMSKAEESFQELLFLLRESLLKVLGDTELLNLFRSATSKQFAAAMKALVFRGHLATEA